MLRAPFVFLAALATLIGIATAAEERAPNLMVILADDMGWADLGQDGSKIDTPNLDRLVGLQAATSTVGSVLFPPLVGVVMGASSSAFAVSVLMLTLAAGGGIWVLGPGRRRAA